ncbi:MAG: globin [Bacteroidetes bacterium]|nr:globin [Bacteroidota bacterium]
MQSIAKRTTLLVATAFVLLTSATSVIAQEKKEKPLYDRLGGVYAIASVVDDFIERLLVNDILNANPAIKEARDRVPKAGLKYRVTELVCQVTDGPQKYTGRSMKDSHKHLNITEKEWDAMVADFKVTLNKFKVPTKEQEELIGIVATTKADIVMAPKAGKK